MKIQKRTLKRIPGKEIVAEFALGTFYSNSRLDPNDYYKILGFDPNTSIGMSTIRDHYRDLIKKYHPDGWEPNGELFEKVQIAYEVLGDAKSRMKYDTLEIGQEWPDRFVLEKLQRQTKNLETLNLINEMLQGVTKKKKSEDFFQKFQDLIQYNKMMQAEYKHVLPELNNTVMYYYEEEGMPDAETWEAMITSIRSGMWSLKIREGVKLGYTTQPTHIVKKSWGEVLMVDGIPSDSEELVKIYIYPEYRKSTNITVVSDV